MGTIQKRADELKSGDVVRMVKYPMPPNYQPQENECDRLVVLADFGSIGEQRSFIFTRLNAGEHPSDYKLHPRTFAPDELLDVEAPELTPAQQNADILAKALLGAAEILMNFENLSVSDFHKARAAWKELAQVAIDVARPPEPPTLAEALESIDALTSETSNMPKARGYALGLLDRARRAGVLE